jgi:tetratricopeptide (TPR) repeat protein
LSKRTKARWTRPWSIEPPHCFKRGALCLTREKFRAIAQVGLRRLQFQTGQYSQLLADYKKDLDKLPEAAQAEVLLLAANSERQLGHPKEAEALYQPDHDKVSRIARKQRTPLTSN